MKILYGVQGTGNGHLSRARAMATAFKAQKVDVDFLFSGRDPDKFFDMQCFGDYRTRRGLTFVNRDGRVDYLRTVIGNDYPRFLADVFALDLSAYDLILTDFEPITAWAGRLRGKTVVSMGHQPAFHFPVPVARRDLRTTLVMRLFAPGRVRIGLHWDRFNAPLLPPLVEVGHGPVSREERKVLVYLPFENRGRVEALLMQLPQFEFFVYAPDCEHEQRGNLQLRPTSLQGFRSDLHNCSAVLCNAGFELASECLALGKRLMVKPQAQQMEQASNALALQQLGYGSAIDELDLDSIRDWLEQDSPIPRFRYPDVAAAISQWLRAGDFSAQSVQALSDRLWRDVDTGHCVGDLSTLQPALS